MPFTVLGSFAALQAALDGGYFAQNGLDVKLSEGNGSGLVLQTLASGQDDIAVLNVPVTMGGIQKGVDVKVVGVMYGRSMSGILSPATVGITKPTDLYGKRISVAPGNTGSFLWPAFVKLNGLDASKVNVVTAGIESSGTLMMTGKLDGNVQQVTTDSVQFEQENFAVASLPFSNFGLVNLDTGIVVTNKTLQQRPDVVRGFMSALVKGWNDTVKNPTGPTANLKKNFQTSLTAQSLLKQWQNCQAFVYTERTKGKPIFTMDSQDWTDTQNVLLEGKYLPEAKPVDTYFTNAFVPTS